MARVWPKKGEGLIFTRKGSKDLPGSRRVHVMVAKHGGKRLFVMNNDPSQSSKAAMNLLGSVESDLLKIPPRSPGLNPIENIFHLVKSNLRKKAINKRIEAENFSQFQERVVYALNSIPYDIIHKTIAYFM
jgi:transposase